METGKPGPRISAGRTAEIFAWGPDLILKLIRPEFPGRLADDEAAITNTVREAGIRAPAVEGLVEVLERRIDNLQIPPEMTEARSLRDEVAAAPARRPDGEAVCHGDLHPGNVIMSPQGPVIIDWIDASRGDPLADEVVTAWLPVVAAARIGENIPGEQPRMLALIKGSSLALNAEFSTRAAGRRGRT